MKFVINSQEMLPQLQKMATFVSNSTVSRSISDCFIEKIKPKDDTVWQNQSVFNQVGEDYQEEDDTVWQNQSVFNTLTTTFHQVEPFKGNVPSRLVGFNEARCEKEHHGTVHFYIADRLFECTWNTPDKYVPILKQYNSVIGPDFSQYVDMTYDERYYNAWRNHIWHNGKPTKEAYPLTLQMQELLRRIRNLTK